MTEPKLEGSIYATALLGGEEVTLELVVAGDARQIRLLLPVLDISKLLSDVLKYVGIESLDPGALGPDSPWNKMLVDIQIKPSIVMSQSTSGGDGKSSAVKASFEFVDPFKFGGDVDIGPLKISLEPKITVYAVYVEYDKAAGGLNVKAKVLFEDSTQTSQTRALSDGPAKTDKEKAQIVSYPFPVPAQKKAEKPSFEVKYFGMGQRFGPIVDIGASDPIRSTMDALEAQLTSSDPETVLTELVQKYYHPDRDWFIGAHILIRGFEFRIIFNDPAVYGLEITASDGKLKGLMLEILYERLGPHTGVYYGALTIPEAFRTIDLGAVAITFPSIKLWIYTNGDFKVSIGWPLGDNSIVIQVEVFMGGGGFYFAKLRSADNPGPWRTTAGYLRTETYFQTNPDQLRKIGEYIEAGATATNIAAINAIMETGGVPAETKAKIDKVLQAAGAYNPVIEFGLAVFWGVGRKINKGPISAELSLTLQGTFQGVLAWNAQESGKAATISQPPDDFWIAASVGVVGVLQGAVDLVIIKASISVRIAITAGVAFQTNYKTIVKVSAEVSVRVGIKIAFFTIHISFHATVGHTFVLGSGVGEASMTGPQGPLEGFQPPGQLPPKAQAREALAPMAAMQAAPMAQMARHPAPAPAQTRDAHNPAPLGAERFAKREAGAQEPTKTITLQFVLHPTVTYATPGAGTAQAVAQLLISAPDPEAPVDGTDFEKLVSHFEDFLIAQYGPSWSHVVAALHEGDQAAPADFADKLKTWLETIEIAIQPVDLSVTQGVKSMAAFPMLPELVLTHDATVTAFGTHANAPTAPAIPTDYPEILNLYFQELSLAELATTGDKKDPVGTLDMTSSGISLARHVFTDYFLLIARQVADHMASGEDPTGRRHAALNDSELTFLTSVSGMASRYLLHGLRLPDPAKVPTSLPKDPKPSDIDWASTGIASLYELTGQQIAIAPDAKDLSAALSFHADAQPASWSILGDGVASMKTPAGEVPPVALPDAPDPGFTKAARGTPPAGGDTVISALPPLTPHPLFYTVKNRTLWSTPTGDNSLVPLPEPLLSEVARGAVTVTVSTETPAEDGTPRGAIGATPGLAIHLEITRLRTPTNANAGQGAPTGQYLKDVYQISGIDEETRDLIERALDIDMEERAKVGAGVLDNAELSFAYLDGAGLLQPKDQVPLLAKVNLSTTSQPNSPRSVMALQRKALALGVPTDALQGPASALPTDLEGRQNFLRLLWESAIVNAPGFYLNIGDVPDDAFTDGDTLAGAIILSFPPEAPQVALAPFHNVLSVEQSDSSLFIEVVNLFKCVPTYPSGCIGFELQSDTVTGDENPFSGATLRSLYSLVQFQIQKSPDNAGAGVPVFDASLWSHALGPAKDGDAPINTYRAIVPVFAFVSAESAANSIAAAGPLTLLQSKSRYAAVGGTPDIAFLLDDAFGNHLIPHRATIPFQVLYHDALVPSDEWPGMSLAYRITGTGGQNAALELTASFNLANVVGVDRVTIAGPTSGQTLNAETLTVYGTVRDPRDSVTVTAQNQVAATVNPDGTWFAPGVTLAAGENTITATAQPPGGAKPLTAAITVSFDASGETPVPPAMSVDTIAGRARVALGRYAIIVDQLADQNTRIELFSTLEVGPVSITSPGDGTLVSNEAATVTGLVEDPSSTVTVNGVAASVDPTNGHFTAKDIPLAPGRNEIAATATPTGGSPQQATIVVYQGKTDCAYPASSVPGTSQRVGTDGDLREPIQKVIAGAVDQLRAVAEGQTAAAPDPATISLTLDLASLTTRLDDIFNVGTYLRLSRAGTPALLDMEAVVEMPSVASVTSEIPADLIRARQAAVAGGRLKSGGAEGSVTLAQFAEDFETACQGFDGADGKVKLASRPRHGAGAATTTELWAVKWSQTKGLHVDFPNAAGTAGPIYFAPKPLATKLLSGKVPVQTFAVEDNKIVATPVTRSYSGVALDDWARDFISVFTDLMRADMATAAARLAPQSYLAMMDHKASMARSIGRALAPVFKDQIGKGDLDAARDRFEQALLVSLGSDYTTSAVVQVPAEISVSGIAETGSNVPPRLFGSVAAPVISVFSPLPGATVDTAKLTITGRVDHRIARVDVAAASASDRDAMQGGTATVEDGHAFTATVDLTDKGENVIRLTALSAEGRIIAKSVLTVTFDPKAKTTGGGSAVVPGAPQKDYSLSTTQLPLIAGGSDARHLEFLVTATDDSLSNRARLELALNYHVENIEHAFDPTEADFGYTPSSWLKVVRADPGSALDFDLGWFDIPLPLRAFPDPPLLIGQASAPNILPPDNGVIITAPTSGSVLNTNRVTIAGRLPADADVSSVTVRINGGTEMNADIDRATNRFVLSDAPLFDGNTPVGPDYTITATAIAPSSGGSGGLVGEYTVDITSLAGVPVDHAIDAVLKWNYDVRLGVRPNAHDELWVETIFNPPVKGMNDPKTAPPAGAVARDGVGDLADGLFNAIAAFNAGYEGLAPLLADLPKDARDNTGVALAQQAYAQTEALVGNLAQAWAGAIEAEGLKIGLHPDGAKPGWYMIRFPDPEPGQSEPDHLIVYAFQPEQAADPMWPEINAKAYNEPPKPETAAPPPFPPGYDSGTWWVATYPFDASHSSAGGLPDQISLLEFRWAGLHMLELQSATTAAYIVRNADLGDDLSQATNPDFVYSTPTVQFATPAVPFASVGRMGPLAPQPALAQSLLPIFEPFTRLKLDVPRLMKVDVRYGYQLIPGPNARTRGLWTELPVLLVSDLQLGSDEGEVESFVGKLAQSIIAWHGSSGMSENDDPAVLSLGISVFAQLPESEVQLVNLASVDFTVTDSWWNPAGK